MQRQVPVDVAELQTERDRMRAENAMLSRKLEVRVRELKARIAEQSAEVARHRNRLEQMAASLRKGETMTEERVAELKALRDQVALYEAELAQRTGTMQSLSNTVEVRDEEMSRQQRKVAALTSEITARDKLIADLQARLEAAQRPIEDQITEVEKRSEALATEIKSLDENWSKKVEEVESAPLLELAKPEAAKPAADGAEAAQAATSVVPPPPPPRGSGNVVSLAARIKALQKDLSRHS
jgi:chromosome segregation ATPase